MTATMPISSAIPILPRGPATTPKRKTPTDFQVEADAHNARTDEIAVLHFLLGVYPAAAPREGIDHITGYKRSSRDAYIQRLKSRQLVSVEGREVRASDHLFGR